MFWSDLLVAFIIAIIFASLLVTIFGKSRFGLSLFIIFLILFAGVWAGGIWFTPIGPKLFEVYWLPFVVVAIVLSLLVAALSPSKTDRHPPVKMITKEEENKTKKEKKSVSLFVWFLLIALIIIIILRYTIGL